MPALISEVEAAGIRAALAIVLVHTHTRTPVSGSADDGYGGSTSEGTPVAALPCRYEVEDRLRLRDGDRVTVSTPTVTVPHDDPIKVGDLVSNVQDAAGVVLLAGPVAVESVVAEADLGLVLQKRAVLRGGDIV